MSNATIQGPPSGDGRPTAAGTLVPVAPVRGDLVLAAGASHANPVVTTPLDQKAIIASVRRRWFPAVSLGLAVAVIAAGVVWVALPLTYTAYAELRVHSVAPKVVFEPHESRQQFEVYRQTQSRMIKSPFVLSAALRDPKVAKLSVIRDEPHPVDWLEQNVSVSNPATEFLKVSLSGQEPKELAAIVNAITKEFLDEVENTQTQSRSKRIQELEKAHRDLDDKLKQKMTAFKRLAKALQTGDPAALTEKQKMMMELTGMLRKQRAQLHFELIREKNKLATASAGIDPETELQVPNAVIDMHLAEDPDVQSAEAAIKRRRDALDQLNNRVKDKEHKVLALAKKELETAEANLEQVKARQRPLIAERWRAETRGRTEQTLSQLSDSVQFTKAMLSELDKELEVNQGEVATAGSSVIELESLRDEIDQRKKIDQKITEEMTRLSVEEKAENRVTLYREAAVPHRPDYEKKFRIVGMAGFGGLALVFAGIVWLDVRTRRISSLDEVATGLRLPIMGSLPSVPRRLVGGKTRAGAAKADVWQGSLLESVDSARVMLLRRAEVENAKVAMIVSAMMSEGKTTLSCHLATSLARAGHRTLLIDTDIRRPTVHRVFDVPCEPGMCELLRKEVQLEDVVVPTMQEGLFVLPGGRLSPEALRELAQDALNPIMARLREEYDFIIVDSSPILPVTDSLLVSQYVDGVIFSIRRDVSQYPKVATACQRLAMIGIPLWGAVVIGLDQVSYGYRYAYAYGAKSAAG